MKLLLIGRGRMGQLVEALAAAHGCEVAAVAEIDAPVERVLASTPAVDVAIDFSHGDAVRSNLAALSARRVNAVIGTTGWQAHEAELKSLASAAGIGVLASANFSLGMNVFLVLAEHAARQFGGLPDVGGWIHEAHHAAKKDAPSGTALLLLNGMKAAGYPRPIDVSSTRAGAIPGTHTIGFDGQAETVTLTHTVRDRAVFAHGALEAAKWVAGRRGWFSMRDMINSQQSPAGTAPSR